MNMQALMKQAQALQKDMTKAQNEIEKQEFEGESSVVKVKINGKREIISIDISPEIVDPDDIETLSDIMVAAVNEAIKKVDSTSEQEMQKITGPLGSMGSIPGLF